MPALDFNITTNSRQSGMTAFAGGGQANATQITKRFSRFDTVAVNNASAKLDDAIAGTARKVQNNGANDMLLYPKTGENFYGLAANAPLFIVSGQQVEVLCYDATEWTII